MLLIGKGGTSRHRKSATWDKKCRFRGMGSRQKLIREPVGRPFMRSGARRCLPQEPDPPKTAFFVPNWLRRMSVGVMRNSLWGLLGLTRAPGPQGLPGRQGRYDAGAARAGKTPCTSSRQGRFPGGRSLRTTYFSPVAVRSWHATKAARSSSQVGISNTPVRRAIMLSSSMR